MSQRVSVALSLFCAALAYGQTPGNSVTVTATRPSAAQPDQVVFIVSVTSPLSTSRDDVIAALQGSGITLASFTGVSTMQQYPQTVSQQPQTVLQWSFSLTAPLANMKSTVASLTALQMSIAKANNGLSVSFMVQGTQVSSQAAQAAPCSLSDLVADARTQATQIATAASMSLGSILSMTSSTPAASTACVLTVKFALGGF